MFVVGSGRSGTSTMAGTLRTLGLHVPQPEVVADATNPKGFGEPRWVVDLHHELLAAQQRAGLRRPSPRLARHRHHERRPRHPRARGGVARGAVRGRRRARHQGPPRLVVPRAVARGRRPLRRHVVLRHDAAAGDRGGRLQADLLRPDGGRLRPGRRHPHRRVGQHDAPHRARHPRPAARLRPLRRPPRRLDAARLRPRRGLRPRGREDRDGRRHRRGAPLHRPVAAPGHRDLGRHRRARPPPRARRRDLAGARRDRRPTTPPSTRSGATGCAPPTPRSTPRRRRSPTRRSWPSGVRRLPRHVARPRRAAGRGGARRPGAPHRARHGAAGRPPEAAPGPGPGASAGRRSGKA